MKILNLYSGIGGNRALWGDEHQITSVEINQEIADKYKTLFPGDELIVGDAHQYLLDHYQEYDFIWSSPPCQTHSRTNYFINAISESRYPDMKLWQEIIFLKTFYKGKYVVENVISYYEPIWHPQIIGRHYFWSNFVIPKIPQPKDDIGTMMKGKKQKAYKKPLEERNAVNSELGLHVFNRAFEIHQDNNTQQGQLF